MGDTLPEDCWAVLSTALNFPSFPETTVSDTPFLLPSDDLASLELAAISVPPLCRAGVLEVDFDKVSDGVFVGDETGEGRLDIGLAFTAFEFVGAEAVTIVWELPPEGVVFVYFEPGGIIKIDEVTNEVMITRIFKI